jgi:hypothetical protein
MITLALFRFEWLVEFLIWGAMAAMAFWVWKSAKGNAPLMTLIGAACLALVGLLPILGVYDVMIFALAGSILVVAGYYLTVKPIVDKRIADLKASKAPPAS